MRKILFFCSFLAISLTVLGESSSLQKISISTYKNKVAGGWAGKMIGVEYGAPYEFKHDNELFEGDIPWDPEIVKESLDNDDLFVQMCYMMVMDSLGLNCSTEALEAAVANAKFELCHANRMARRNYWRGIMPPLSGNPKYNMHADDIDFQIESDFIGFIFPAMPISSNILCNRVGHIMCYGDGVYGGAFVAAMHAQAFFEANIEKIILSALKAIPAKSQYAQCIREIINGYRMHPNDWRRTWKEFTDKWGNTDICVPNHPFNEDAKYNGAYVVLALLYGNGDFGRTMEIAVRSGQDTDCNAATSAGILGTIIGYDAIEEKWKAAIPEIADTPFLFTNLTFNKVIKSCLNFAQQNVKKNGGNFSNTDLYIKVQQPKSSLPFEQSFLNIHYSYQTTVTQASDWTFNGTWHDFVLGRGDNDIFKCSANAGDKLQLKFKGKAILLEGYCNNNGGKADVYLDGRFAETIDFYYRDEAGIYLGNRAHLFHRLNLSDKYHTLCLVVRNDKNVKSVGKNVWIERAIIYK
jgi:hypothetical protein